jgi:hypothetical protein
LAYRGLCCGASTSSALDKYAWAIGISLRDRPRLTR